VSRATAARVFSQAARDNLLQIVGKSSRDLSGKPWLLVQDCRQRGHFGVTLKCSLTCYHLVQHRTETENVRTCIDRFSRRLLRRHVRSRPENHPFFRLGLHGTRRLMLTHLRLFSQFCQTEVEHFYQAAFANHDVSGLRSRWMIPAAWAFARAAAICVP